MKKIYVLLFSIIALNAFAQNYDYTSYHPGNSGFPSTGVNDIATDTNGVLWLGTFDGVVSYNGTTFTTYNTANSQLPYNSVGKIEIDNLNRKYILTYSGLARLDGTTWTNYTPANSGLPSINVNDIAVDGLNNLWVATSNGLAKYNGTTWVTYNIDNSEIGSNLIFSVVTDSNNLVWLSDQSGLLKKFDGTTFTIVGDQVNKLLKANVNDIYFRSGNGFMKYTNGDLTGNYQFGTSCLSSCAVMDLDTDEDNKIWTALFPECGAGGVQNVSDCSTYGPTNSGIPGNGISSLKVISSDLIWVGSNLNGLVKMSRNSLGTNNVISQDKKSFVYPNPVTNSFKVQNSEDLNFSYFVYDLTGKLLLKGDSKYNESIDSSVLPSGSYVVKTIGVNTVAEFHKIIKG